MVDIVTLYTPVAWRSDPGLRGHGIFDALLARCRDFPAVRTAVCHPCSEVALAGAIEAAEAGLIEPILIGPEQAIGALARQLEVSLDGFDLVDAKDETEAAAKSVALCRRGDAAILMKGSLSTATLMHAVADRAGGLRNAGRLSHVYVFDAPAYPRPLLITDAAVNIAPTLAEKADIVRNAIALAHAIGIAAPRVAVLAAVEIVNPDMPSTIDAAALCKMAQRGQIVGGELDGPLAFDTAINAEAARIKQLDSAVAGRADILVVPDLESGNMLAKQLEYLGGATAAGIVVGARVPIVLTSRADPPQSRRVSCALAAMLAHAQPQWTLRAPAE